MKLRYVALTLAVVFLSAAARAQSGVFVTFDAQQFTQQGIYLNSGTHGNVDRPWVFGPNYGVYCDVTRLPHLSVLKTGPVVVGLDARGDTYRVSEYGSQLDRQDGLLSLRVAPKKTFLGSTPYVLGGFGIAHTRRPFSASYSNNLIYQAGIGSDRKIAKHIDWRVFEARVAVLANYTVGAVLGPNQSNYLVTIGTGVIFRMH